MKVLFLDIDGVINTVGAELGFRYCYGLQESYPRSEKHKQKFFFDPACLYYLREIVKETGCKIVISSTWRLGATIEEMKSWFECPEIKDAIIDKTPIFHPDTHPLLVDRRGRLQRGEEIKAWLDAHPEATHYAILDDDSDMDVVMDGFFKTCSYDGLKKDVAYKVIFHLKNEGLTDHYRLNLALTKFLSELNSCLGRGESLMDTCREITQMIDKQVKIKRKEDESRNLPSDS